MVVAAVLATAAGCTSKPAEMQVNAPVQTQPPLPACAEVFKPGQPVDKAKASAGCTDPNGGVQFVGVTCNDGTMMWQVDAKTGAPGGYAQEGKPYTEVNGDPAADPGYKTAYEACNG